MKTLWRKDSLMRTVKLRDMTGKRYYILRLYDLGKRTCSSLGNRLKLGYELQHAGKVMFVSDALECPVHYKPWEDEPVKAALNFVSTPDEDYTSEQNDWIEDNGGYISLKSKERFGE